MFLRAWSLGSILLTLICRADQVPFIYTGGSASTTIGTWSKVLVDSSASLAPGQVAGMRFPDVDPGQVPNHGVSRAAHWHRFTIINVSDEPGLTMSVPYAEIEELDLYRIIGGKPVPVGKNGRSIPWEERTDRDHEFVFQLALPPRTSGEYLLRAHGFKAIHVPIIVSSKASFAKARASRNMIIGGFIGVMLVMAVYNLFVFIAIRDRSYLLYVLYILAICSAQTTLLGYGPFDLLHGSSWVGARASILFALISVLLGMAFARRFIGTRQLMPRFDRVAPVFHVLVIIDLGILFFIDPWTGYEFAQGISGLSAVYLLILSIRALRMGSRQARFFLLAWAAFLLGVVAFILKDEGLLPFNDLTQFAMPVGSAIEGVLLSFGLADRINVLRREKELSQLAALEASRENERIIREQNTMLETKVKERTHALQESNEHLKRTQTQLVNAEKMASLGQLTAGIAHEINNPINFITSNIAPLRRNIGEIIDIMSGYRTIRTEEAAEELKKIREREERMGIEESIAELNDIIASIAEGSTRTADIVRGLRNFSRLDEDDLKECDLNEGLRSTLTVLAPQYRDKVRFELELGDLPKVECFPGKVNQVFMNILTNAVQATQARRNGPPPEVHILTRQTGDHVEILIRDNGIGMNEETRSRIYEPFFTTKDVGEGTGLGMAIVYSIIEEHQGHIDLDSMPDVGTEFRITLPIRKQRTNQKRA